MAIPKPSLIRKLWRYACPSELLWARTEGFQWSAASSHGNLTFCTASCCHLLPV